MLLRILVHVYHRAVWGAFALSNYSHFQVNWAQICCLNNYDLSCLYPWMCLVNSLMRQQHLPPPNAWTNNVKLTDKNHLSEFEAFLMKIVLSCSIFLCCFGPVRFGYFFLEDGLMDWLRDEYYAAYPLISWFPKEGIIHRLLCCLSLCHFSTPMVSHWPWQVAVIE